MANNLLYGHDPSGSLIAQNPGDISRTTEGPSATQWETQKDEIRILYEERPLKEVKKILDERGFVAT